MLYGFLGEQFGKVHTYDVKSPAEAVRALSVTLKGFKQSFIDGGSYRVLLGGKEELELEQTINPCSSRETIRIIPYIQGSSGIVKIVVGAALIAIGVFIPGPWSPYLINAGTALILGGISQLLFKPPEAETQEEVKNRPSFVFNGAINTTRQGGSVPVCFGRVIVGSQVISAGLSVSENQVTSSGGGK
jgi:predicted phage tail protein